jgi:sigma-B regulation protein RsbU (phosphoserine phosphatase)
MLPNVSYENSAFTMNIGGALVLCSDAAPEAENKQREPFGSERLQAVVGTVPPTDITNIPDKIIMALTAWRGEKTLEDDLTIVALERT